MNSQLQALQSFQTTNNFKDFIIPIASNLSPVDAQTHQKTDGAKPYDTVLNQGLINTDMTSNLGGSMRSISNTLDVRKAN